MFNRRRFLLLGAAGLALSLGPRTGAILDSNGNRLSERLSWIFSDLSAARAVGRKYLESHPRQAAVPTWMGAEDATALKKNIAKRRERDFREGDIVFVDGWVLAQTEAHLCALAVLV